MFFVCLCKSVNCYVNNVNLDACMISSKRITCILNFDNGLIVFFYLHMLLTVLLPGDFQTDC